MHNNGFQICISVNFLPRACLFNIYFKKFDMLFFQQIEKVPKTVK